MYKYYHVSAILTDITFSSRRSYDRPNLSHFNEAVATIENSIFYYSSLQEKAF